MYFANYLTQEINISTGLLGLRNLFCPRFVKKFEKLGNLGTDRHGSWRKALLKVEELCVTVSICLVPYYYFLQITKKLIYSLVQ